MAPKQRAAVGANGWYGVRILDQATRKSIRKGMVGGDNNALVCICAGSRLRWAVEPIVLGCSNVHNSRRYHRGSYHRRNHNIGVL